MSTGKTAWSHDEALPIVARLVQKVCGETANLAMHSELCDALLEDAEGLRCIKRAMMKDRKRTRFLIAKDMVAWFGARFGPSNYHESTKGFRKRKCGKTLAYYPKEFGSAPRLSSQQPATLVLPPLRRVVPKIVSPKAVLRAIKKTGVQGGGAGRRSSNAKVVGDRAEHIVLKHLKDSLPAPQAATLVWRAQKGEFPGWDIDYVDTGNRIIAVEVKGTVGMNFATVEVTDNEWNAARRKGRCYHLYLVSECGGRTPRVSLLRNPAALIRAGELYIFASTWTIVRGGTERGSSVQKQPLGQRDDDHETLSDGG